MKINQSTAAIGFSIALSLAAINMSYFGSPSKTTIRPEFVPGDAVVTFDSAKYLNARRAGMAKLLNLVESGDENVPPPSVINDIDKHAREKIEKLANGRLVIVTQALSISGQVPDITDQVIRELGLPETKVTIVSDVEDMASNYSTSDIYALAKKALERKNAQAVKDAARIKKEIAEEMNNNLLP